jgi:hypothetical protein
MRLGVRATGAARRFCSGLGVGLGLGVVFWVYRFQNKMYGTRAWRNRTSGLSFYRAERKPYDLLLFPDERHSPRSLADRTYMEERIHRFFLRSFGMLELGMGSGMKTTIDH